MTPAVQSSFAATGSPREPRGIVMKEKLCDVNGAAAEKLPEHTGDKSGVGVHYVDAYIKPMNVKLADGTRVKCKRRGLKVTLTVGDKSGEGLLRRLAVSPNPVEMLQAALAEAAAGAGVKLLLEDSAIYLVTGDG